MNPSLLAFFRNFLRKYHIPFDAETVNGTGFIVANTLLVTIHQAVDYHNESATIVSLYGNRPGMSGYCTDIGELKYRVLELLYAHRDITVAATKQINESIKLFDGRVKLQPIMVRQY